MSATGQITLTGMAVSTSEWGSCITLLYEDTPGPAYGALVRYMVRHDDLEQAVNRQLEAAGWVTVGPPALPHRPYLTFGGASHVSAVKTFFSSSHQTLSDQLQNWLQHSETTILSISMDSNDYGHCLVVLHEPGAARRYDAQVVFSSKHDQLEGLANQALYPLRPGGQQLVAVGSNNYGHCLCIIREV